LTYLDQLTSPAASSREVSIAEPRAMCKSELDRTFDGRHLQRIDLSTVRVSSSTTTSKVHVDVQVKVNVD
jgi:hypothetical protein